MVAGSFVLALSLGSFASPDQGSSVPQKSLRAARTKTPIKIDGVGDEPVWAQAPVGTGFVERSPDLRARPPVRTSIRVAYDDQNLYILVDSELQNQRLPKAQNLRRDSGNIFADDFLDLKIDPFRDLRSTYAFVTNAAGAQYDALALEDGRVYIRRWDGIWKTKSQSRPGGFTTEYQIPLYVLGIRSTDQQVMGFNLSRRDYLRPADYDWRLIPPPQSAVGASTYGVLEGLDQLSSRAVIELVPFGLATTDFKSKFSVDPRRQPNLVAGLDARFQTGPGGYIEASVLTDFSQVDADQVQVATDRFPLFFPEQRPFFLNGADVFNFGHESTAQLYFSRRIGLDGQVAPILGGVKAYGRRPKLSYGVMAVQTGRALGDDDLAKPAATFGVTRIRAQPIPNLAVGIIGIGRKSIGTTGRGDALSLGLDVDLRSKDNRMRSYTFVAGSWSRPDAPPSEAESASSKETEPVLSGWSFSNRTEYRHLYLRPSLTWLWSNPEFTAPLGFYVRPGTAQHEAQLLFAPRPKFLNLRELSLGPTLALDTSPDYSQQLTYRGRLDLKLFWNSNWKFGYFFEGTEDRILKEFEVFGDQKVQPGRYTNRLHGAWIDSPGQKAVSASIEYNGGQRFGGPYHKATGVLEARIGRSVAMNGSYSHIWGQLPGAARGFQVGSANAQTAVSLSTQITMDWLMRLDRTPGRASLGNQARLRWRFAQGSDLFLVYANRIPLDERTAQGDSAHHRLTLKFNWYTTFRAGVN